MAVVTTANAVTKPTVSAMINGLRQQGWVADADDEMSDGTGGLLLVFQGRRRIPGIQPGARLVVEGMVGDWARRQAILNPDYELIAGPEAAEAPT